eukprot:CAMPEP_0180040572 /NCGR_PEP_ID=MMETSP0984-20121128/33560_1 /TAXON_ID=483367 /ORGANISM="non described non described, Strain CCMP 2436" /LENGTH=337 /DNA_ID=CAMNT_0021967879 /DNA_START=21 /DNA_END=1033 /DNA_ORIENTATION=-
MTGTIHVNNDALRQLLVDDSLSASQRASSFALGLTTKSLQQSQAQLYGRGSAPVVNRAPTHPHMHAPKQRRNAEDREAARTELRVKYEEEQSLIKRGAADAAGREHQQREEEDRFARMYNELMMEEEDFVALVKDYCKLDDQNRLRKQEALCRDWHEKVFNKVQRQIGKQLKSTSSHEIAERRRKLYDQFLAAANSKESGLFRDIIIESEYDPMIAHKYTIKYKSHVENDPVKLEVNKAARESQELPGEFMEKVQLGRATLKVTMWDKLEATPYGRFNKMMGSTKVDHGTFKANLQMDHYAFPRGKEVTDEEFPKGKRTYPDWKPGKNLHDLNTGDF